MATRKARATEEAPPGAPTVTLPALRGAWADFRDTLHADGVRELEMLKKIDAFFAGLAA